MEFSFEAEDCIAMRKAVQKFYLGIADGRDNVLPNVVDAAKPWEDVAADFQMLMYMYLLLEANREIDRATEIYFTKPVISKRSGEVVGEKQVYIIRDEAKVVLAEYRRDYAKLKAHMPMNNVEFLSQYADVDEAISERMQQIVQQTYYPILNDSLKNSEGVNSLVAQAVAHTITGMCLAMMACERGMRDNHHVPSRTLDMLSNRICRLAAVTTQVNNCGITYNEEALEKIVTTCSNVTINVLQEALNDIMKRATEIDLEPYVAAADYTKERFVHMIKTKTYDCKAEQRRLRMKQKKERLNM